MLSSLVIATLRFLLSLKVDCKLSSTSYSQLSSKLRALSFSHAHSLLSSLTLLTRALSAGGRSSRHDDRRLRGAVPQPHERDGTHASALRRSASSLPDGPAATERRRVRRVGFEAAAGHSGSRVRRSAALGARSSAVLHQRGADSKRVPARR